MKSRARIGSRDFGSSLGRGYKDKRPLDVLRFHGNSADRGYVRYLRRVRCGIENDRIHVGCDCFGEEVQSVGSSSGPERLAARTRFGSGGNSTRKSRALRMPTPFATPKSTVRPFLASTMSSSTRGIYVRAVHKFCETYMNFRVWNWRAATLDRNGHKWLDPNTLAR